MRTVHVKPWVVATVVDRGPREFYRYRLEGVNLDVTMPNGEPRPFSWSVADFEPRYDLSRARFDFSAAMEFEWEADGRTIGSVSGMPGVIVYGDTPDEARQKLEALAAAVLKERTEPYAFARARALIDGGDDPAPEAGP